MSEFDRCHISFRSRGLFAVSYPLFSFLFFFSSRLTLALFFPVALSRHFFFYSSRLTFALFFLVLKVSASNNNSVLIVKKHSVESCLLRTVKVRSYAHSQKSLTGMTLCKYGRGMCITGSKGNADMNAWAFFQALIFLSLDFFSHSSLDL